MITPAAVDGEVGLDAGQHIMTGAPTVGVPVPLGSGRALSPMQRGLWASQLSQPDAPLQNMPLLSHLDGPVDPARLAAAFDDVVRRSDVLRTRLTGRDAHDGRWGVALIDGAQLPTSEIVHIGRSEVDAWARARGRTPLDMTVCGYDSAIAVHDDQTVSWYLNLHHVITDATSSAMVFNATAAAYTDSPRTSTTEEDRPRPANGMSPGNGEAAVSGSGGASYYRWASKLGDGLQNPTDSMTRRSLDHWRQRDPAPRIGRLYKPADDPTPDATRLPLPIGSNLLAEAEARLGADYRMLTDDLGWSTLLITATALYCHRVSGADRFAIGMPVHNRSGAEARELIGPTMEVFPVDIEIDRQDTFRRLHKRVGRAVLNTLRHAAPGTSPTPDFEAVVNVIPRAEQIRFGSIPATTRWLHSGAIDPGHLLRVQLTGYAADRADSHDTEDGDQSGAREFALDLNHGAGEEQHHRRATGHYISILEDLIGAPDEPIGRHSICGRAELERLALWEHGPPAEDHPALIGARLFKALAGNQRPVLGMASADPDRAVDLTGDDLWRWISSTARWLADHGVRPGDRVGVELVRSPEAVAAIMAILAAGASFVPLDPVQPEIRRKRLAARADCVLVISDIDEITALRHTSTGGLEFEPVAMADGDEAYLLFTSGSTGEPKGVPISHGGLARYIRFAEDNYTVATGTGTEPPVAPLFSALTFDLTITSLFMPILAGGTLLVVAEDGPRGLSAIAARPDVNWCKATPSHLELLVRLLPKDHGLQTLVVGGEAFGSRLASDLLAFKSDLRIFNEYGPTEAVVGCMIHQADQRELGFKAEVPIGRPAPGVSLMIVDQYQQRVPIGAPGELCISHLGVTGGYLGSDEPEAEDDPPFVFIDGKRFYRSGDLVRLDEDDELIYLGRMDEQVKVGGIRLEPIEVEESLNTHPRIERSAVRLWSPARKPPTVHCVRCGLPDNVPGVGFDADNVCETCHAYNRVAPMTRSWFKNTDDLKAKLAETTSRRTGPYDCLHLLSGGKDSTYALYQLVELGFNPYALTLDNGFISEGAKENARRSVAELGIDHEFATSDSMNAIFRDSLERHSNVCHGCYKTIYTLATNRAAEIGAPLIVTGLSRGQLFETRLIPQQFSAERFDPEAIDRAVLEARKVYHRVDDATNRLLDTEVFASDDIFDQIEYLDFYRYVDVELSEMLRFLDERAPWVRPADTGRSTNCLINSAGIHTHQTEQGYHNYAVPYAWDVRLGHKTRSEAIEELDDELDLREVEEMLGTVGYRPRPREVLTAWIEPASEPGDIPTPAELRTFLTDLLPAHAIPSAFVEVESLPLTTNGKLDEAALPAPERVHRPGPTLGLSVTTELERSIIEVWERILHVEPIGPDDDFFALGGDSLAALEMIVAIAESRQRPIGEDMGFTHTTPRALAAALQSTRSAAGTIAGTESQRGSEWGSEAPGRPVPDAYATAPDQPPTFSAGELAVMFDQSNRPDDVMYNVGRLYRVAGPVDSGRFERALRKVAERHQPLTWSYGSTRRRLPSERAVWFSAPTEASSPEAFEEAIATLHREPFDLAEGPLLRCVVQPLLGDSPTTGIFLAVHHASGDAGSFARLWDQIDAELGGRAEHPGGEHPERPENGEHPEHTEHFDYAGYCRWQQDALAETERSYWLDSSGAIPSSTLAIHPPDSSGPSPPDGFLTRVASVAPEEFRAGAKNSPAALSLAAVATTLRRYSTGPEIELGLISSTRRGGAADDLFGYFLNSLPIRLHCGADDSVEQLAGQAAAKIGGALANRAYPLARIVADRHSEGRPAPNLEVLMAFDELEDVSLAGVRTEQRVLSNGTAVAPLTFFVELRNDRIDLSIEYRGSVCTLETASELLRTLDDMLTGCVAGRGGGIAGRQAEAGAAPADVAGSSMLAGSPLTDTTTVLVRIAAHMADGGSDPAVICGREQLSWRRLGWRATALAEALAEQGVTRGDQVLLCLPRSVDLVAAILGIQLAGAAYVPVDPGYPDDRIKLIARTSGATVGIVDPDNRGLAATAIMIDRTGITVDSTLQRWVDVDRRAEGRTPIVASDGAADDPAYVLFTSGSTGEPRGVAVSHRMLASSTNARAEVYPTTPTVFAMVSSVAFDSSIVGLFWTLATGGTVVLPTEDQAHDVVSIGNLLRTGVSHTLMVPTLYQALLSLPKEDRTWPDHVIVAGEACPPALATAHFDAHPATSLTNEYGPTEATVWATAHHCDPRDTAVPIGRPIPGAWVAVIDGDDRVRPAGVEGDLIIGGQGVVNGYLNDPETTNEKFGALPSDEARSLGIAGDSRRFFRTGDRAVVIDGLVRFLGRSDSQLNLGGTRAEPEDIENVLLEADGVAAAVAVTADVRTLSALLETLPTDVIGRAMSESGPSPDPVATLRRELLSAGEPELRLMAHIERRPTTTASGAVIDSTDEARLAGLRAAATNGLPPLLRPGRFEFHDELPRTPNGKIDRQAVALLPLSPPQQTAGVLSHLDLPAHVDLPPHLDPPADDESPRSRTAPSPNDEARRSESEEQLTVDLTALFAKVLRADHYGPDESFFDHGGQSLLAMELLLEIEDRYGVRVSSAALYEAPTPRRFAPKIDRSATDRSRTFLVPIQTRGTLPPIFAVHVLGVDCEFFRPLSARLGDSQPMYGLGQPTADLDTAGPTEVAAVAEVYAKEIDRVAPDGPIALAAISLGGVVAYELAQQLVRQGRDVSLLALFDALGPDAVVNGPSPARKLAAHLQRAGADPLRYASEQAERQGQKITRTRERARLAFSRKLNAPTDHQLEIRRFIEDNLSAQFGYAYDPYPGDMLVLKAADDPFTDFYVESRMGWKDLAIGNLAIEVAPGGHLSMMAEPNVEHVAESFRRALAGAADRGGGSVLNRTAVARLLIAGLRAGRLPATVGDLGRSVVSPEAGELIADVDRVQSGLAALAQRAADEVAGELQQAGVGARVIPVPRRMQHATASIEVDDDPRLVDRVLTSLHYRSIGDPATELTATVDGDGWVDYVRREANTARIRIRWPEAGWGSGSSLARVAGWLTSRSRWGRASSTDLGIFLGTPPALIGPLLRFAEAEAGQLVVDLGCGDGRVLIEACQRFGCRARGYEMDEALVAQARSAVEAAGLTDRIDVVHGDAMAASLHDVDVVFAFLPPEAVASILEPTLDQLPPESRFISHEQLSAAMPRRPDRSGLVVAQDEADPGDGGVTVANLWFGRSGR